MLGQFENGTAMLDPQGSNLVKVTSTTTPGGLFGFWEYNRDLFDATTVARMAGHLEILLGGALAFPGRSVS